MRDAEKAYPEAERKRLEHPGRVRGVGSGRPFSLHPWDRVLLVLMYYRTYLTLDGMTHLFGISQGSISTNIGKMIPIIRECLPVPQRLYWQARKAATVEELNELFPGLVALTDASSNPYSNPCGPTWRNRTTRPRPRPIRSRSSTRPASTGWWSTRRHIPQAAGTTSRCTR